MNTTFECMKQMKVEKSFQLLIMIRFDIKRHLIVLFQQSLYFLVLDSGFTCSLFGVSEPPIDNGLLILKFYCVLYDQHKGDTKNILVRN